MDQAEYQRTFNLPFEEASSFFRDKLNIPTQAWTDLWKEEHAKGFMVAGAMKADLLTDFRESIQKAIDGKLALKEFQGQFDDIVARHGWSHNGSRNWRSELIYNTNVRTAYMAGRWQQLTEPGAKLPYLVYRHADGVRHPRPLHVSWNGITLPADHEFWKTHFPQNGWGCRCTVFAASEKDRQAAIAAGKSEPPAGYNDYTETEVYDKDGKYVRTRRTLPGIDEGWDYNVGQAMFKWQPALDKYPYPVARDLVKELADSRVFQAWHDFIARQVSGEMAKPGFPVLDQEGTIRELRSRLSSDEKFPLAVLPENVKALIGANTQGVYLSDYDLIKQQVSRKGQAFGALDYTSAQDTIENARLILKDGDSITVFINDGAKWYSAVLQTTKDKNEVYLKSFRGSNEQDMLRLKKRGTVLFEK